ncbi:hexokinase type 1-like [Drosophila navojoa]|nr:hexokinase type 1-like [Drosophila navojoa]
MHAHSRQPMSICFSDNQISHLSISLKHFFLHSIHNLNTVNKSQHFVHSKYDISFNKCTPNKQHLYTNTAHKVHKYTNTVYKFPGFHTYSFPKMTRYHPETDFPEAWKILKPFMLSDDALVTIRNSMTRELLNGLGKDTHSRSSIPSWLSYVQQLPSGDERGRFLALEMWPSNCRIMLVKFSSENDIYMSSKCVIIPHTIAASRGTILFNFLAQNIALFVKAKKVEKDNLPMGIAFAFDLNQLSLDVGILIRWTQGYGAQSAIGKNVVQLLRNALDEFKDIKINLNSIVNISTGSLMALAWSCPDCRIGLMVGLVTNAAYVEHVDACERFEEDTKRPLMIVNTDWGNFGSNGHLDFVRTEFDKIIDEQSNNPGMKYYEKCISALNLGELVRLIVVRLIDMGVIFKGASMQSLRIRWKMEMKSILAIESDPPNVYIQAQKVMDKFGIHNCSERDLATLRFICKIVGIRSAKLVAAGLACLINRMSYPRISIAVEGGVYRLYPTYQENLYKYTLMLTDPHNKFEIIASDDSPGVGAALVAGLALSSK